MNTVYQKTKQTNSCSTLYSSSYKCIYLCISIYAQRIDTKVKIWNQKITYEYRGERGQSGFAKPALELVYLSHSCSSYTT